MDLSISIVNHNTRDVLDDCLRSVFDTTRGIEFEVIVVDNASTDGSAEMVESKHPWAKLVSNRDNLGFARANNQVLRVSSGRHILLLNPDTICLDAALAGLVRFLDEHPRAGAVGPLVLNADRTLQYSWARFPTVWGEVAGRLDRRIGGSGLRPSTAEETRALGPFQADWIGGCCLAVRREAVDEVGPMDESIFLYSEETDWCIRLRRAGWEVWVEPRLEIIHLGGRSTEQVPAEAARHLRASKAAYFAKHHGRIAGAFVYAALALRCGLKRVLRLAAC